MNEELSPEEKSAFDAMKAQEPIDQQVLKEEKAPIEQPKPEPQEQETEKEKTVSLNALKEERERRKAAEERARQAELERVRYDERLKAINERLAPKEAPKEIPDPEKDALGALKSTAEEVRELKRYQEQHQNQLRQQAVMQQVMSQAASKEMEFLKENPDYNDAGNFLRQSRMNELVALGQDPFTAQQAIIQESLALAASALQQGKNPAEVVYSLAKSRGYAKSTAVQPAQPEGDAEKLKRIAEGQKANTSLGSLPSSPPKQPLTAKDLVAMDEDEFAAFLDKLPEKQRSKYMGA